MSIPSSQLTTTCDIYRPFGAGSPTTTAVPCRLVPDIGHPVAGNGLAWTHYIDLNDTADVRDGCSRLAASDTVTYADGDEVRIPNASGSRYVVVWVETINRGAVGQYKRAYLMRHAAVWPGP